MQDPPSVDFIRDLASAASDDQARNKFEARMTAAAFELVQRAEALAAQSEAAERERLVALLNEDGDLRSLNERLCALIKSGAMTLATPALAAHLRATTMEKLAIDQPTYAAYRRALEQV